jgi:hypothetical protein
MTIQTAADLPPLQADAMIFCACKGSTAPVDAEDGRFPAREE